AERGDIGATGCKNRQVERSIPGPGPQRVPGIGTERLVELTRQAVDPAQPQLQARFAAARVHAGLGHLKRELVVARAIEVAGQAQRALQEARSPALVFGLDLQPGASVALRQSPLQLLVAPFAVDFCESA